MLRSFIHSYTHTHTLWYNLGEVRIEPTQPHYNTLNHYFHSLLSRQPNQYLYMQQTTCPGSSPVTLLTRVTDSHCDSTVRGTPPFSSSLHFTAALRRSCVEKTILSEPTTTAVHLLLLYRCVLCMGCVELSTLIVSGDV